MRVQTLGQEDPLEKEMATHSSILAWGIPWREEPEGYIQSIGVAESDTAEQLIHTHIQSAEQRPCALQLSKRAQLLNKDNRQKTFCLML